jgi:hypothetical protein
MFFLLYYHVQDCPGQAARLRLAAETRRLATMVTLPLWLGV